MPPSDRSPTVAALRQRLEHAASGLLYTSEGDFPFEFFSVPSSSGDGVLTTARFAALLRLPAGTPVEERTLDAFLAPHIERVDPRDARSQALRPRYEQLKRVLLDALRGVRVFRVGSVELRCYIVGVDDEGNLTGLATTAIET